MANTSFLSFIFANRKNRNDVFDNRKGHHSKIERAFDSSDSGRYNDVEFSLSDGSKLMANKFILATQSEYFDTMFYGSLKHDKTVPLKWCSKTSMEKVLAFLSVGKVEIGDLEIMELLELMEAARLMCLENLSNFVEVYVKHFVDPTSNEKIPLVQALMALDFALVKHFESVTTWLLKFIDKNIKDFIQARPEEAGVLSTNGMVILLGYEGSAKRIDLLAFFTVWKETNQDSGIEIAKYVKLEELNAQELKIARTSNLYPISEITNNLERIVSGYEKIMNETNAKVANQNLMIRGKDAEIKGNKSDIEKHKTEIENLKQTIYENESEIAKMNCFDCRSRHYTACGKKRPCNKCQRCRNNDKNNCLQRIHGV